MGLKGAILRLKGELKSKLTKIKHMEKDKFKTLYRAHAKMYWNLYESRLVEKALNVGDRIPIESLKTYLGEEVNISETLKKGPLVLAFFRGTWCGYCSTEVTYLQENLKNFEDLGATVVAISPQNVEHSKSMVEHQGITYPVVSDNNNLVAKQFGLTYLLTDEVVEALKESYQVDVRKFYGKDVVEVPLPATYVVDSNGVIVYAFIEEDHRKRADISEVLLAINRCRINKKTYFQKAQQCDQLTMCLVKKMIKKCNQELANSANKAKAKAKENKDRRNSDVSRVSITTTALYYCLENDEYLNSFKDFLAKTYCSENLLFYFDSRDYFENYNKKDLNERKNTANTIFENYIKPSSELEVNIDDSTREQITINVKQENYLRDLFESANSEVFKMLETDSFHKWRRTREFDSVWRRNGSPALLAVTPF